jgi:hypothetical protein
MVSNIPAELASALGASPISVVNQLYSFGSSPSNATLANYAISLLQASYGNFTSSDVGFSVSDLMQLTYKLGASPNTTQTWKLACDLISNATQRTFVDSPLFTVNGTALSTLLSNISPNSTSSNVDQAIENVISTKPYLSYPYLPSSALTGNFVNSNNDTMLIVLGFSSNIDSGTIVQVESTVQN